MSQEPTAWAVICGEHGQVFLTREEYDRQMDSPSALWACPECGEVAQWDDDNFDAWENLLDEERGPGPCHTIPGVDAP